MSLPSLAALISQEIHEKGPISFARFMEIALYDPDSGYYAQDAKRVGKAGDFYTSVSLGAGLGAVLACVFEDMWKRLGCPKDFVILEQGANDGSLAADVLTSVSTEFLGCLRYRIVEPLPKVRDLQHERLGSWGQHIEWRESLGACEIFTGVHFSNELVDALPFHLLKSDGKTWCELLVTNTGDNFQFVEAPVSEAISRQNLPVRPAGFLIEERPAARKWITDVAERLERGFLLAMDYGYPRAERLAAHRTRGTFASYKNHVRDENVLHEPGARDLTAHVDFSDLAEAGHAAGLVPCGFCDQHHFVIGAAENLLRNLDGVDPASAPAKILKSLKTLMHPETMGTQFHAFCMATDPTLAEDLPAFRKSWNHFDRLLS